MPNTKVLEVKNQKLDSVVVEFIKQHNTRNCAYELMMVPANQFSTFYLTVVNSYDALTNQKLLVGYATVSGRVVFVTIKADGVFSFSDDALLREQLLPFVPDSFFSAPQSFFDPPIWRIELFADSLTVDKDAFSPDVPIKNIISTDSLPRTQ